MTLELLAPAKLNLALEITGRRPDGYHDLVTVMQTIDLADRVRLEAAPTLELAVDGEALRGVPREGPQNLAFAAARALTEAAGDPTLGARIGLEKHIPAGMGLGGGSSDAAAVLRGLIRLWRLELSDAELRAVAAGLGSDVPFFISGGSALVTGRGEHVELLPDGPDLALTLFVSEIEVTDKTRRMYAMVTPRDYSDGRRARDLAGSIRQGISLASSDLLNTFDALVEEASPPVGRAMTVCREAGVAVVTCGSGPGFFSPMPLAALPSALLRELEGEWGVRAIECRTLTRTEAMAIREV